MRSAILILIGQVIFTAFPSWTYISVAMIPGDTMTAIYKERQVQS